MPNSQSGILAPVPRCAVYMTFSLLHGEDIKAVLSSLCEIVDGDKTVVGLGQSLLDTFKIKLDGLTTFPVMSQNGIDIPSTPTSLWCWLRGEDRGELYLRAREIEHCLITCFILEQMVYSFQYGIGLDLTGYVDGTENPQGEDAVKTAIITGQGDGMDGSSFVAVQQWLHDLDTFQTMPIKKQDDTIGRRKSDNEELATAPESAHVKRTAQESFEPEAFILRRSMPWNEGIDGGLYFVAFGHSLAAFDALLKRMVGLDDDITDALFSFTRPISGAYFWCPPVKDNQLDLSLLNL